MPVVLLDDSEPPWFPHPDTPPPDGLLAVGGSLTTERLLLAYSNGIFPWESWGDPPLWHWFSPDPRFLLFPKEFKVSRSLRNALKKKTFELRIDTAFEEVIRSCSRAPRKNQPGTWIAPDMVEAYSNLHKKGFAHSFESYRDGKLVGGLYGISLGTAFFGESMFHHEPEASKVALAHLVEFAGERDFHFIDCQVPSDHLASLGAREIPRAEFLRLLKQTLESPTVHDSWTPTQ
jgi:leucyl/phenylalanyl-tRNA--protein transferase